MAPGVGFRKCAGSECGSSQDWPKRGVLPQEYGRLEVRVGKITRLEDRRNHCTHWLVERLGTPIACRGGSGGTADRGTACVSKVKRQVRLVVDRQDLPRRRNLPMLRRFVPLEPRDCLLTTPCEESIRSGPVLEATPQSSLPTGTPLGLSSRGGEGFSASR